MVRVIKKYLPIFVVLMCMVMIFLFSGQTNDSSQHLSRRITAQIAQLVGIEDGSQAFERLNYVIRKLAHMTEYALFAAALYFSLSAYSMKKGVQIAAVIGICFLYACTDEFHQLFISGRSSRFFDVMVDTAGAAICMAIAHRWIDKLAGLCKRRGFL